MKTHVHLLVRDALARAFVAAAGGEHDARVLLEALERWATGAPGGNALAALRAEDGEPLFERERSLAARFAPLEPYVRDRARRYRAALAWIDSEGRSDLPIECARAAWDAGLFFEVHELLEPVWMAAPPGAERDRLQALIMAGAALHHLSEGNRAGARGLLSDAARRLEGAGPAPPHDWPAFASALRELAGAIERGELRRVEELCDLPRLERTAR